MNGQVFRALVAATWRERLTRPIALAVCLLLCLSMAMSAITAGHTLQDPVLLLTLILASGSVGREVSSGVLALLLTRPVVRTTYVVAKWTAVSTAAAALSCLTLAVQAIALRADGVDISARELWAAVFASATSAAGLSALLVLLSVLLPGAADVAAWGALNLLGFLAQRLLSMRANVEWRAFLQPKLGWVSTFGATPVSWFGLASYLSTVTLCLVLAALAMNRKEISYASG